MVGTTAAPPGKRAATGHLPDLAGLHPDDPQIDRSAPTVKADAAWRAYDARGRGIVWAVIDSGIDACHPHFSSWSWPRRAAARCRHGLTSGLHRDFSFLVNPDDPPRRRRSADAGP